MKGRRSKAMKKVQNMKQKQTSLSDNKEVGKASVAETNNAPPIAGIAFKPPADDLLIQIFEKFGGKQCFKCHSKVQTESMVLCQCGYFICQDCFLAGCYCTEERNGNDDASKQPKHKEENSAYYIPVASSSQMINLDGKVFELECLFSNPIPM